jgi:hypothetical protein
MTAKRLTNLEKKRKLERSRRDTRVRKIKKYGYLCVSKRFFEYAIQRQGDNETADAAALVMHYCFLRRRKINDSGWVPIPYQAFRGMFGKGYKRIVDHLIAIGFLEYDEVRRARKGSPKKKGRCSYYRICQELRNDEITASYAPQSEVMQKLFIKQKEYWLRISKQKRLERMTAKIDVAFATPDSPAFKDGSQSYYYLVEQGYLTEEQFATLMRLAKNAHLLEIQVDDADFQAIAKKQYANQKAAGKVKCDFDAYMQRMYGMVERASRKKIKVDEYGRLHVPMTNLMRGLWDFVSYKNQQLVALDVKSSHVVTILALIKDIAIHYFGSDGTHEERLASCQFSRQIEMIPGLVAHLRRVSGIYQACVYFEFKKHIPDDVTERRKMMYSLFEKFTKRHVKDIQNVKQNYFLGQPNHVNDQVNLVSFLQEFYLGMPNSPNSKKIDKRKNCSSTQLLTNRKIDTANNLALNCQHFENPEIQDDHITCDVKPSSCNPNNNILHTNSPTLEP